MNERNLQLRTVGNRLMLLLGALVAVAIPATIAAYYWKGQQYPIPTPVAIFFVGFVGGFVGLQRRLKALPDDDLTLLANSWTYILLSPLAGAILAELVYVVFVSGLLQGDMFPSFHPDAVTQPASYSLKTLFEVHCEAPADYAKVIFWSFLAGFSEKFATNIIGQFEAREVQGQPHTEDIATEEIPTEEGGVRVTAS
jgi:hypothetical protein